jgi:hypothetical protein
MKDELWVIKPNGNIIMFEFFLDSGEPKIHFYNNDTIYISILLEFYSNSINPIAKNKHEENKYIETMKISAKVKREAMIFMLSTQLY